MNFFHVVMPESQRAGQVYEHWTSWLQTGKMGPQSSSSKEMAALLFPSLFYSFFPLLSILYLLKHALPSSCIDRNMDGVVHDGISLMLFFRVEIGSCAPSFWVIIRARPLSTTMMRVERRVSISQQLRVSATLLTIWQKSPSVTCRLWMWMTGIHGNSESLGNYQSSSPNVNLKIKTLRALSFLTISWLITGNTCVCNKSWSILVRGGKIIVMNRNHDYRVVRFSTFHWISQEAFCWADVGPGS